MKRLMLIIAIMLAGLTLFGKEYLFVCEEFPPYEYNPASPQGMDIEVLALIFKETNMTYRIAFYPWKRCLLMMEQGKADGVFSIMKTSERVKIMNFPEYPISSDKRVVLYRKGSPKVYCVGDLKGKTVGVISGNRYGGGFDEAPMEKDLSVDGKMLCEKFKLGRSSYIAVNEYLAKYYLKGFTDYEIAFTISEEPFYIAFKKDFPIKAFNDAHRKVLKKKKPIYSKYK